MKRKILNYLDLICFAVLIVATILVIAFEFSGSVVVLETAIILYAVCLAFLIGFTVARICVSFKMSKMLSGENVPPQDNLSEENVNLDEVDKENLVDADGNAQTNASDNSKVDEDEKELVLTKNQMICAWVKLGFAVAALVLVLIACFMF